MSKLTKNFILLFAIVCNHMSIPSILYANQGEQINIVCSVTSSKIAKFAASELSRYLQLVLNKKISTSAKLEENKINIVLDRNQSEVVIAADPSKNDNSKDWYVISPKKNNIYLVGSNDRSLLYAVYEFLESLGCRWVAPNFDYNKKSSEYVPTLEKLHLPIAEVNSNAKFHYRSLFYTLPVDKYGKNKLSLIAIIDWMAKNKMNVFSVNISSYFDLPKELFEAAEVRGIEIATEGHSWNFLSKKFNINYNRQLCTDSNDIINKIAMSTAKISAHGYIPKYLGPWGEDNTNWSVCFLDNVKDPRSRAEKFYSLLASYSPKTNFLMIAYQDFLEPKADISYPSNTYIYICPIDRDFNKLLYDSNSKANSKYKAAIESWSNSKYATKLLYYSYYNKNAWHGIPFNTPNLMSAEMKWLSQYNFYGASIYVSEKDWLAYEVQNTVFARLAWDPRLDVKLFLSHHTKEFLPSYNDEVQAFFGEFEKIVISTMGNGYFGLNLKTMINKNADELKAILQNLNQIKIKLKIYSDDVKCTEFEKNYIKTKLLWVEHLTAKVALALDLKTNNSKNIFLQSIYYKFIKSSAMSGFIIPEFLPNENDEFIKF